LRGGGGVPVRRGRGGRSHVRSVGGPGRATARGARGRAVRALAAAQGRVRAPVRGTRARGRLRRGRLLVGAPCRGVRGVPPRDRAAQEGRADLEEGAPHHRHVELGDGVVTPVALATFGVSGR